jgi:asparagine synthase (glutamine-hydrolysing)
MGWTPEWDVDAVVSGTWQVGEGTLFKGVKKVLPGCWIEVEVGGGEEGMKGGRYWYVKLLLLSRVNAAQCSSGADWHC